MAKAPRAMLARLVHQPRILHRDDRLRREILQQRDLFIGESPHLASCDHKGAQRRGIFYQGDKNNGVYIPDFDCRNRGGIAVFVKVGHGHIEDLNNSLAAR